MEEPKKRGRPKKVILEPQVKRPPGRPRKVAPTESEIALANAEIERMMGAESAPAIGKKSVTRLATQADVKSTMWEIIEAKKMPKVTSLEELMQRCDQYFMRCAKNGIYPTMEELYCYTGYNQYTIFHWLNGSKKPPWGEATLEVLRSAKDYIMTFDAKMVIAGKLDFLTYCFRAKNFYGMQEKQEVIVTPNNPLGEEKSKKELEERYIASTYSIVDAEEKPGE